MFVRLILLAAVLYVSAAFTSNRDDILNGAWQLKSDSAEEVLLFADGYCTLTDYNKAYREFNYTTGGKISLQNDSLVIATEFHSADLAQASGIRIAKIAFTDGELTTDWGGNKQVWVRIDRGGNPLSGCWRINGRMQGDKMMEMPLRSRRTLKILSGTRFQWVAINVDTKEFFGTGGGTYTFKDGKYIEQIEFFSRDSSRVGALLSFDDKVENDVWMHAGLSSKGDPIKENWIKMDK